MAIHENPIMNDLGYRPVDPDTTRAIRRMNAQRALEPARLALFHAMVDSEISNMHTKDQPQKKDDIPEGFITDASNGEADPEVLRDIGYEGPFDVDLN